MNKHVCVRDGKTSTVRERESDFLEHSTQDIVTVWGGGLLHAFSLGTRDLRIPFKWACFGDHYGTLQNKSETLSSSNGWNESRF